MAHMARQVSAGIPVDKYRKAAAMGQKPFERRSNLFPRYRHLVRSARMGPDGYRVDPAHVDTQCIAHGFTNRSRGLDIKRIKIDVRMLVANAQLRLLRHSVIPAFQETPTSCQ